jgi:hypothetical protein
MEGHMKNYSTKNRGILITFILLVSFTFLFSPASLATNDAPNGVHLNWSLDEVHSTINVTWGTNSAGSGNIVYYDDESRNGNPGEYEFKAEGHHEKIIGEEGKTVGYAHHVTLKGLSPGKTYYFVSGGEKGGFSEEFKFQTLPKNPEELHFAAYGDTRPGAIDFPKGRNAVAREMASHDPQFMIHSGDYIEDPFNGEQWKEYFSHVESLYVDSEGYLIPIVPVVGNHEVGMSNSKKGARVYHSYFDLPNNERWYTLKLAPYFKFFGLNSETYTGPASDQHQWLEKELKETGDGVWKFSASHKPSFGEGYGGEGSSSKFLPLFDEYHMDIALEGDYHMYARSQPLNTTSSPGEYVPYKKGTVHVLAAGGGAPLYSAKPAWWHASGPISKYSYTIFNVSKSSLKMKAYDTKGDVLDRMEIHKELSKPQTVLETKKTGVSSDSTGPPPLVGFNEGARIPIMKVSKVGDGTVGAGGLAWSSVNGEWKSGELDVFYDLLFERLNSGGKKVLWYGGYEANYSVKECSDLVKSLEEKGFDIEGRDQEPITTELLSGYDILVIPQLGLGDPLKGGNPDLLPWSDVNAIEEFVREGNGLLVMDAHDYGGHNWAEVQNKILAGVGADMTLQSDGLYDWSDNWKAFYYPMGEVNTDTELGKEYKKRTGKTEIALFEVSSVVNNPSLYLEKIPGGEKTVVDARKAKANARVHIKTKEGGSGYVRIQKTPGSSVSSAMAGVHEPLVEVNVQTGISPEKIDWPMTIELYYEPADFEASMLQNESQLEMYYWDTEQAAWRRCQEVGVNTDRDAVIASAYHLTKFAIMSDPK